MKARQAVAGILQTTVMMTQVAKPPPPPVAMIQVAVATVIVMTLQAFALPILPKDYSTRHHQVQGAHLPTSR